MVTDLTKGNPEKTLWKFTLPMIISVMFQQLYSTVDSIVAGQFAGVNALAAVGASYPVTMIFIAIANGSNIGCSVVISQLFGSKRITHMKTAVNTSIISSVVLSFILTAVGLTSSKALLRAMGTPDNIMADSVTYLNIYAAGMAFLFIYNISTAVFTALGDSKTPLYFLIFSSLTNIVLDLIFAGPMKMGIAGVAWATFIAQGVSGILAFIALLRKIHNIQSEKPQIFSGRMLLRITKVAVPSILQQSFVSVGNVFIQGLINSFGAAVVAGFAAAMKLNTFTITTLVTLSNGISSYTAQNIGAHNTDRVKKGFGSGLKIALLVALPFFIAFFFFPKYMMMIFVSHDNTDVITAGVQFLKIVSPFYFLATVKIIVDGILRGSGAMLSFMVSTFTDLILRVIFAFILTPRIGQLGIWWSWPIGWIVASLASLTLYLSGVWKKAKV